MSDKLQLPEYQVSIIPKRIIHTWKKQTVQNLIDVLSKVENKESEIVFGAEEGDIGFMPILGAEETTYGEIPIVILH